MLSKTDRLIQQQIARYFSRLSAETKIGLLMKSSSVNMNEDVEADANDLAVRIGNWPNKAEDKEGPFKI